MFFLHHICCISPQETYSTVDIEKLNTAKENRLFAVEPAYSEIPPGILRRMGKAVRMGVGAAMKIAKQKPEGIIVGTADGGLEDCIKFLNQIIDYKEGVLTPTNFVQSTTNAIASQIGLLSTNKGYNCTHVHRGLAFENAILDVAMLLKENPTHHYLLGGVDEISDYNYNIERLAGWYKKENITGADFYEKKSPGSIPGEGAAMFLASNEKAGASAGLEDICFFHSGDENFIATALKKFIDKNFPGNEKPDLFFSGENGDDRFLKYYAACEQIIGEDIAVARFKHATGEYSTAVAFAVWLAAYVLSKQVLPSHFLKYPSNRKQFSKILIYNNYKGVQHSFILISKT